jgi:hypothetical protein
MPVENSIAVTVEDLKLSWPVSILNEVFGPDKIARDSFVNTFLEPDQNNSHLVRFFFRDLHYLLVAIHYVLSYVWDGRLIGSPMAEENSCTPIEQRSPNLDPISITLLYQMDLLCYFASRG